jgi:hypothetical protein
MRLFSQQGDQLLIEPLSGHAFVLLSSTSFSSIKHPRSTLKYFLNW